MAKPTAGGDGSDLDKAAQQICSGLLSHDGATVAAAKLELEQLLMWQLSSAQELSAAVQILADSLPLPLGGEMEENKVFVVQDYMDLEGALHRMLDPTSIHDC